MAKCDYCGSTILFGGKRDANGRFCNQKCQGRGALLAISRQFPEAVVQERVWKAHQGLCPKCKGAGPVDAHVSHKIWSAVVLTSWSSTPQICCRSCGLKSQLGSAGFSALFGWWGIPWGLVLTPIQIGRDLVAIARPPDPAKPSAQLEKIVRMQLAAETVRQQRTQSLAAGTA